jgi:hypothetical protein
MKWFLLAIVCFGIYKVFITKNKLYSIDEKGKPNSDVPWIVYVLVLFAFVSGMSFGEDSENERIFKNCKCKDHRCFCDFELQAEADDAQNEINENSVLRGR